MDIEKALNAFYEQLENVHLNVIADLNTTTKKRHNEHLNSLSSLLVLLDEIYIYLVPNGFFHLLPNVHPDVAKLSRIGYSIGLMVRFLENDLKYS